MKLYEFGFSRSARCHWILTEADAEYESVTVDLTGGEHKKPEFLAINPYGKVPVLEDEGKVVTESAAICTYIAEKYPDKELIPPAATYERAVYYQWMSYCLAELEPSLWTIRKHTVLYPKARRLLAAVKLAKEEYLTAVKILAQRLSIKPYIIGDEFTGVDVIIGYNLVWANMYKLIHDFPSLQTYLDKLKQRPAFPEHLFED